MSLDNSFLGKTWSTFIVTEAGNECSESSLHLTLLCNLSTVLPAKSVELNVANQPSPLWTYTLCSDWLWLENSKVLYAEFSQHKSYLKLADLTVPCSKKSRRRISEVVCYSLSSIKINGYKSCSSLVGSVALSNFSCYPCRLKWYPKSLSQKM